MLQELLDITKSVDFEDFGSLKLTHVVWSEEKSILYFDVADDYRPELHPHWQVVCSGVREESLSFGHYYNFDIYDDHVLLWQYLKCQTSVSFYGSAKDPSAEAINALDDKKSLADEFAGKQREEIVRALTDSKGRVGGEDGAAARLAINRTTLLSRMKKLRIHPKRFS